MYGFTYHQPRTLDEATKLLADGEARSLAGGQTLIPVLKMRLSNPGLLVDLKGIAGLDTIEKKGTALSIGALARHAVVAASPVVRESILALAALAGSIGDVRVRNRGTIGGSVANSDPAADYPAAVLGLGATIVTTQREIPADSFFTGMFETALKPGEIVVSVVFPIPRRAAYIKYPSPASHYAMVGVFVAETAKGIRVAITGASSHVFRWSAAEAALGKSFVAASIGDIEMPADDLLSDVHGDAAYRASLVATMTKRAVSAAAT